MIAASVLLDIIFTFSSSVFLILNGCVLLTGTKILLCNRSYVPTRRYCKVSISVSMALLYMPLMYSWVAGEKWVYFPNALEPFLYMFVHIAASVVVLDWHQSILEQAEVVESIVVHNKNKGEIVYFDEERVESLVKSYGIPCTEVLSSDIVSPPKETVRL